MRSYSTHFNVSIYKKEISIFWKILDREGPLMQCCQIEDASPKNRYAYAHKEEHVYERMYIVFLCVRISSTYFQKSHIFHLFVTISTA